MIDNRGESGGGGAVDKDNNVGLCKDDTLHNARYACHDVGEAALHKCLSHCMLSVKLYPSLLHSLLLQNNNMLKRKEN